MTIDGLRDLAQVLLYRPAVLATVIQVRGSVPREVGAKMVIAEGQINQTIGGGAGEAKVIRQAEEVLQTGKKQTVEIDLTGTMATSRATEGICGGQMTVWLERWTGEEALLLLRQLLNCLDHGQPVTLVTPLEQARSPYLLTTPPSEACDRAFVETLQPPPTLLIVGAGHCGIQLAKVVHLSGFQILVQDDRPEWANAQHYPQASQIWTEPIAAVVDHLKNHTQLYAALVTRGYACDVAALEALLNRALPCPYIGMIGSEKRVQQVFQAMVAKEISLHALQSIHAPIGLDIGALTPAEIAVSIAAELILVRRGGSGRPLSVKRLMPVKLSEPLP